MKVFALADLHLSLAGHKPMDVFGEIWRDHPARMAASWDRIVSPDDTVLLPGDLSWARDLDEAKPDLSWIGERPGRKLLLRGNHDGWWGSAAKVRRALPEGCEILHNESLEIGDWVLVGTRGWTAPGDPYARPGDERIFHRELNRLRLSLDHADRFHGQDRPRIAMVHFPPWIDGQPASEVVATLREGQVRVCAYGHLHGEDHRLAVRGLREGIEFHFVAADATGFRPVEIPLPGGAATR